MLDELKKWALENKLTAVVIALSMMIVLATVAKHLLTPKSIRNIPPGYHECVGKNGLFYSNQPCMPEETTIENPADAKKAEQNTQENK